MGCCRHVVDTFCLKRGQGDDSDEAMAHLEDLVSQMNLSQTGFDLACLALHMCVTSTASHGVELVRVVTTGFNTVRLNMSQSPKSNSLQENISILLVSGHYLHC